MSVKTSIQWCDSSSNLQMGCEGCELVKGLDKAKCYAKQLTDRYQGVNKGWPDSFEKPKLFMHRLPVMLGWSDLTGKSRIDKPWLDGLPRIIFLNDMGDTFTKGLPEDWFKDVLPAISQSPHQYLVLTKWPARFKKFADKYPLPDNVWAGTSITSAKTMFRGLQIANVSKTPWLSIEPLWGPVTLGKILDHVKWVVIGGESGSSPEPCQIEWIQDIVIQCIQAKVPVFIKQLGTYQAKILNLKDGHGGNWDEWPEPLISLRSRQMPEPQVMNS